MTGNYFQNVIAVKSQFALWLRTRFNITILLVILSKPTPVILKESLLNMEMKKVVQINREVSKIK